MKKTALEFGYFALIVIGLYLVFSDMVKKPEPEIIREVKTVVDTLIIQDTLYIDKPFYIDAPAKIETVYTDKTFNPVAVLDTLIEADSAYLRAEYYFPPINRFKIDLEVKEKIIERVRLVKELETVTIERAPEFYRNHWFYSTLISLALLFLTITK